ncbi:MAG TPA: glycosyltransferase [Bacteroides sp.]|nr:glycosyltransferase [Bacteroides sp.]
MMKRMSASQMMEEINREKILTWFDLGLYIDRFKENNPIPTAEFHGNLEDFKGYLNNRSMAFATFHYSIDGVTIEVEKYSKIFQRKFPDINIHYIAGQFFPEAEELLGNGAKRFEMKELRGFDDWELYKDFYFTKLERGSQEYNALIIKLWKQVKKICKKLGQYIEDNEISLLYIINICSNPGNVAYCLSLVLISEYLGIPVVNNNHDFYWEGGSRPVDLKLNRVGKGPRDFFFTNSDIGEFFSIIEILYPWESRSWINVNINKGQTEHLIKQNGHNPANIFEIGTAVDTNIYQNISKRDKINAYLQIEKILSRYKKTLVGYSVKDVISNKLVDQKNPKPILIGSKTKAIDKFSSENIVFLQPTRIISRKRIEVSFLLIKGIFLDPVFIDHLEKNPNLKLTLLITGPIAAGQYAYFEKLIESFDRFMDQLREEYRERIYMACLFSELDRESFKKRFKHPAGIPELYNIASLILLPSKTEGRGLPIIEATACGTPIFCRRYEPTDVYREVIGEHLEEKDRLRVIGFDGKNIKPKHTHEIIDRIFFPNKYVDEVLHNRRAVMKRYSLISLEENLTEIYKRVYNQLLSNRDSMEITRKALIDFRERVGFRNSDLEALVNTEHRNYLPGYGKLKFMLLLKSLIDPSFFRIEQQMFKGIALSFARAIITRDPSHKNLSEEKTTAFYNAVDNIFSYREGEIEIRHDHSMSYRHRNNNYYPYQDCTIQELTGVINLLYNKIIKPRIRLHLEESPHFFTDWKLALSQLTTSPILAIDDRYKLIEKMHKNLPIAYFPGDFLKYELEFFALQSVRSRLRLKIEEELTAEQLENAGIIIAPVYIFAQEHSIVRQLNKTDIIEYIEKGKNSELKLLYKHRILRIVSTEQLSVGIHFPQLGARALKILRKIQEEGGYIITNRRNATVMTDIVSIDRFHIGKVRSQVSANMLGIPVQSGYIQFVPAGLRATLSYPTPTQTAKDLSEALKSELYFKLCDTMGEEKVLKKLQDDAFTGGSPVIQVLKELEGKEEKISQVNYKYVSGLYKDGHPWSGAIANANNIGSGKNWKFVAVSAKQSPMRVTAFCKKFEESTGNSAKIAWNGGYILNPELVGKLGLPETYIGSPLGMIISEHKLLSAPLFNKAAMLIYPDGKIEIKRVNVSGGFRIQTNKSNIEFQAEGYNNSAPDIPYSYYDLLSDKKEISATGRVIVRLAGTRIKEVIRDAEKVPVIPVGLTLSFRKDVFQEEFGMVDRELDLILYGMENVEHAVEAGPMLLSNGKISINMKTEGWKSRNSIITQAARLDYTDMRGPKIAVGTDSSGNLSVLTINGRIRESVGATHQDMADILQKFNITDAMGFDPGGSSTLVVEGDTKNISPYNHEYEKNIYSLPSEPRAVSNAVIGFISGSE